MDCCKRGVKGELVIETDGNQVQDKEEFPHDSDPTLRKKKIEIENSYENEAHIDNNNNYVVEIGESNMKEMEQNENKEENINVNIPGTDTKIAAENNIENYQINDNNLAQNEANYFYSEQYGQIEQNQNQENNINNNETTNANIEAYLNNYNIEQVTEGQNVENAEDYNKYFEQNPSQQNNNADFDINQYLSNNNETNNNNNIEYNGAFTFAEPQTSENQNIQGSQSYNNEYANYNI